MEYFNGKLLNKLYNMKSLNQFVNEQNTFNAFRVNQNYKPEEHSYSCQPKSRDELQKIIKERLKEDPNADLNDIDTSKIKNMSYLFFQSDPHNIDISEWDISNVTDMSNMFKYCSNLNCDIYTWNFSKVTNMNGMFYYCKKFNGDLSNWNVNKVTSMNEMFWGCENFEGKGLDTWDISSNLKHINKMFIACKKLDCDLGGWDVSNVEDMFGTFRSCEKFKGTGLKHWNVSNVQYMAELFSNCENFNEDISGWNLESVESMRDMFNNCKKFNHDLSKWNIKRIKEMNFWDRGWMNTIFNGCDSLKTKPSWWHTQKEYSTDLP